MKLHHAAVVAGALALAGPAQAAAEPTLTATPEKKCYRDKEKITLDGAGFGAGAQVNVFRDDTRLNDDPIVTSDLGTFSGKLTLAQTTGVLERTYTATDMANSSMTASLNITVSAVEVKVSPESAPPGTLRKLSARGFTNGERLFAHIVRRKSGKTRTLRLGRLTGACGKLKARARLVPKDIGPGVYMIQFDTKRRYSSHTGVRDRWHLSVVMARAGASASASRGS
ncbi:MAG TPA: hypothetical protein VGF25_10395 [Thermoleophilaceae bacterium]